MFDIEDFVAACERAVADADPRGATRELLRQTMSRRHAVADRLARDTAGIEVLYNAADLTVLNVTWAPKMTLHPHEHRMWAAIGIYTGAETNRLYRRGRTRIQPAGERELDTGDVFGLGRDAIHAIHNPRRQFTGALHIYGGDFVNTPRSQWDPDSLLERPFDMADVQRQFAEANAAWRAQLGSDLDEGVTTD